MANSKSALKRARQTLKRTARNKSVKAAVRTYVRKARAAIVATDATNAPETVKTAVSQLAKAASKGVLHKRNVARRISRLMKQANAAKAAQAQG